MTYTEAEIKTMMKGSGSTVSQAKHPNYKKVDRDIYEQHKSGIGFTEKSLKERYESFSFSDEFKFGLGLGKLPESVYSGNLGPSSKYIDKRLEVLNEIIGLFENAKTPEDKHKIVALLEMSKKAAGDDPSKAAHYIEAIEAAKVAISGDKEAKQNFKDYEKSFIYDDQAFNRTLNELAKRREHLQAIKSHGYDSFETQGWAGRISDHGLQAAAEAIGTYQTGASLYKAPSVWRAISIMSGDKNSMLRMGAQQTLQKSPILTPIIRGLRTAGSFLGKHITTAVKAIPGWGKVALGVGAVIYGGAKICVACKDKDDFWRNLGSTVKETYYGDAKNFVAATASWILPGFGSLYGTSYFNSTKENELTELRQGVLA